MAEILVVDDEIGIRELLSEILGDEGHSVLLADCAAQARKLREENPLDLVLLDIWMPDTDGVTLLKEWVSAGKLTMPVIMMSGHATIDTAVEATRIGALDFLEKPIALQKLLKAVEQGLARARMPQALQRPAVSAPLPTSSFSGAHPSGSSPADAFAPAESRSSEPLVSTAATDGFIAVATSFVSSDDTQRNGALRELALDLPLREARDAFERAYFEHHLSRENGSMTRVAEKTGLERTHLYRKLKQLGIDLSRGAYRKASGN